MLSLKTKNEITALITPDPESGIPTLFLDVLESALNVARNNPEYSIKDILDTIQDVSGDYVDFE